ncbi:hypothetical protein B0H11DRAFT_2081906, partial [Mycena galericulata]
MARGAQFSLEALLRCRCRARSESQLRSFLAFVSTQFRLSISRRNRPRLDRYRCLALPLSLSLLAIDHSMSPLRFTAPQQSTPPTHARWASQMHREPGARSNGWAFLLLRTEQLRVFDVTKAIYHRRPGSSSSSSSRVMATCAPPPFQVGHAPLRARAARRTLMTILTTVV